MLTVIRQLDSNPWLLPSLLQLVYRKTIMLSSSMIRPVEHTRIRLLLVMITFTATLLQFINQNIQVSTLSVQIILFYKLYLYLLSDMQSTLLHYLVVTNQLRTPTQTLDLNHSILMVTDVMRLQEMTLDTSPTTFHPKNSPPQIQALNSMLLT